jgi:hypothetical protein
MLALGVSSSTTSSGARWRSLTFIDPVESLICIVWSSRFRKENSVFAARRMAVDPTWISASPS